MNLTNFLQWLVILLVIMILSLFLMFKWRRRRVRSIVLKTETTITVTASPKPDVELKQFRISIAHPKLLSKRFASSFLVQIYPRDLRAAVRRQIKSDFGNRRTKEWHKMASELSIGRWVKINLSSPEISFSPKFVTKKLKDKVNTARFLGKPNDKCYPGLQSVVLSMNDSKTGEELQSEFFEVRVTDFVFDHVSRPLLSKTVAAMSFSGSVIMFILALLKQIDTAFGFLSGTAGLFIAGVVYKNFLSLFSFKSESSP